MNILGVGLQEKKHCPRLLLAQIFKTNAKPSHFLLRSQVSKWALLATHGPGFLGNPAPVSLVARRSTGFFLQFRVYSWIVIAAHRRKMYLVGAAGTLEIVLS